MTEIAAESEEQRMQRIEAVLRRGPSYIRRIAQELGMRYEAVASLLGRMSVRGRAVRIGAACDAGFDVNFGVRAWALPGTPELPKSQRPKRAAPVLPRDEVAVLEALKRAGPASWPTLAQRCGLTPSAAKKACQRLRKMRRIRESGRELQRGRNGGYPRVVWALVQPSAARDTRSRRGRSGSGVIAGPRVIRGYVF